VRQLLGQATVRVADLPAAGAGLVTESRGAEMDANERGAVGATSEPCQPDCLNLRVPELVAPAVDMARKRKFADWRWSGPAQLHPRHPSDQSPGVAHPIAEANR